MFSDATRDGVSCVTRSSECFLALLSGEFESIDRYPNSDRPNPGTSASRRSHLQARVYISPYRGRDCAILQRKSTILRHIAHAEGDDTLHSRVRRGEVARMATKAPFSLVIPPLNTDSKAALLQAQNTRNPLKTLKPLGVWRDLGAEPLTLARG